MVSADAPCARDEQASRDSCQLLKPQALYNLRAAENEEEHSGNCFPPHVPMQKTEAKQNIQSDQGSQSEGGPALHVHEVCIHEGSREEHFVDGGSKALFFY